MAADEGSGVPGTGLETTIERAENVVSEAKAFLSAYQNAIQQAPVANTATASVVSSSNMAALIAVCAVLAAAAMTWVATRDRDAADKVRIAQVEAINARWKADIEIRDARAQAQAAERTAELRILAADRRADMAELESMRADLVYAKGQAGISRTLAEQLGQRFAKLEAKVQ
jgi:hypothetical protein